MGKATSDVSYRGIDLFSESGRDISSGSSPSDSEALLFINPDLEAYILMSM